ncbi:hypothetical protein [Amycolatopsis taiwanensis]|uniref:Uncharacterized protein n=1 Tax=Amycolatopsis taiwanensis TaxID=342230 RepID=A0A9W6QZY4_9PSEU|nr:hypothetical protein [Amycolatopsis taiwanensis]GLY65020.1 hypothetical protein Atai01_16390 [Amycolatopsis taiwanensis]
MVDNGSAITLVGDPVDGTANAVAEVPLAAFAGVVAIDCKAVESLTTWLDTRTRRPASQARGRRAGGVTSSAPR